MNGKEICIGYGGSWHPTEGNTSLLIKPKEDVGFLFDCGETVFSKIKEDNLLKDLKVLNILITHLHPDHVGSLGSLIMYSYYKLGLKPNIYYPNQKKLTKLLELQGVSSDSYNYLNNLKDSYIKNLRYIEVEHTPTLQAYSYVYSFKGGINIYSGDLAHLNDEILEVVNNENFRRIYLDIDVSNKSPVHLNLKEVEEKIPEGLYNKVFAMHLNTDEEIEKLKSKGFSVLSDLKQ